MTTFITLAVSVIMASICFRIRLDLDGLILVLRFETFLSTFAKMTDYQGIKITIFL